jgi:hypothetical protein
VKIASMWVAAVMHYGLSANNPDTLLMRFYIYVIKKKKKKRDNNGEGKTPRIYILLPLKLRKHRKFDNRINKEIKHPNVKLIPKVFIYLFVSLNRFSSIACTRGIYFIITLRSFSFSDYTITQNTIFIIVCCYLFIYFFCTVYKHMFYKKVFRGFHLKYFGNVNWEPYSKMVFMYVWFKQVIILLCFLILWNNTNMIIVYKILW